MNILIFRMQYWALNFGKSVFHLENCNIHNKYLIMEAVNFIFDEIRKEVYASLNGITYKIVIPLETNEVDNTT